MANLFYASQKAVVSCVALSCTVAPTAPNANKNCFLHLSNGFVIQKG